MENIKFEFIALYFFEKGKKQKPPFYYKYARKLNFYSRMVGLTVCRKKFTRSRCNATNKSVNHESWQITTEKLLIYTNAARAFWFTINIEIERGEKGKAHTPWREAKREEENQQQHAFSRLSAVHCSAAQHHNTHLIYVTCETKNQNYGY